MAGMLGAAVLAPASPPGPPSALPSGLPAGLAAGLGAAPATPERVTRLWLGEFGAPEPGVRESAAPPAGVLRARGAAPRRTLVLRRPTTPGFSAVGVTWVGGRRQAPVSAAVRVRRAGAWTPWRAAAPDDAGRDDAGTGQAPGRLRDGAELQWWGPASGVEVAVSAPAGRPPGDIAVDLIDPGRRPGDASAAASPPGADAGRAARKPSPYLIPRVRMPTIIRRAGWGADERKMGWTPEYVPYLKAATVHHTATTNNYTAAQVPAILRSIYHFQAVSRGWGDIGYNVLVDRFGRLWEGRAGGLSRPVIGAHSGGYNSYTTGLAFIGDHRTRSVPHRSLEAAARFLAWKFSLSVAFTPTGRVRLTGGGSTSKYRFGTTIVAYRIHGHRRTNATNCPGARGMAALNRLRARTKALMGAWTRPATQRMRLTLWRPSTATWYLRGRPGALLRAARGDLPVPADFDGDGTTDLTTWRPATGRWTIRGSAHRRVGLATLGRWGQRPVPADTNGDGKAEPMTWEPGTGLWYRRGRPPVRWGARPGDVPVPADYNGDGRADLAVWRPGTGTWHIRGVGTVAVGAAGQLPVPADYDGDGQVEPATWSPQTHRFYLRDRPPREFGRRGDIPVPGQYDGDPAGELAVWGAGRRWLIDGIGAVRFGTKGDRPIPVS